jgi:hypothetical protein
MSFNSFGEAKKPFVDAIKPSCEVDDPDFGTRKCLRAMSLACNMGKLTLEAGDLDSASLENFTEFVDQCPNGLEIDETCSTGHQVCNHPLMPEYQSPGLKELAQQLFND